MEIQRSVLSHTAENRRAVLHGMRGDSKHAVPAVRHRRLLGFSCNAPRPCGSMSYSMRCPAMKYNLFPSKPVCATPPLKPPCPQAQTHTPPTPKPLEPHP